MCDQDPERAKAIGRSYPGLRVETDPQRVFTDPEIDAVALATPVSTHYALAKAALRAGKSVLVEKPLTANAEHAQELIDLAQRLGLVLMVDHVYVHSPAVKMIKELVDTGALGDLLYIDNVRINLGLFQRDVNVVWDLAPHDLSIVDHLLGRLPRSLAAFGAAHAGQDLQAAVGIEQMKRLGDLVARRRALAGRYTAALADHPYLTTPFVPDYAEPNFQSYAVRLRPGASVSRNRLIEHLLERGIAAKAGIMTAHRESAYRDRCPGLRLPNTEKASDQSVLLPLYPTLTEEEQDQIIAVLFEAFASATRANSPSVEISTCAG